MAITASQVNELRQKTGAGMMDCKKALTEADGDFEKAIELLRKKGAAVAEKRAERTANEGSVLTKTEGDKGYIVEVNCETDFVANSAEFKNFAALVLDTIVATNPANVEELLKNNPNVQDALTEVTGKVGEKIEIKRFFIDKAENGVVIGYIHMGAKLGVLIRVDNSGANDEIAAIAKDVAMQVAAMKPICVYRDEVSKEVVDKEIDIYKELLRKEGKKEEMLDKIAVGKLNKFYQENCLAEQAFIKDNSKTVQDLIKEYNAKNGTQAKIIHFRRFHLGDENK